MVDAPFKTIHRSIEGEDSIDATRNSRRRKVITIKLAALVDNGQSLYKPQQKSAAASSSNSQQRKSAVAASS